ncbi:hypothetical protein NE237_009919 [Protea cynaroides]|uniref:Leucine-rich repeat-containing N-terminal plant-type domain-containing protein n=1 Tax=Protea cynaroides TaxID=273540 RepID=A0A9Q0R138_9MAGN|nr:hypothetical protein NE237_009919 [Protea cynaroides]
MDGGSAATRLSFLLLAVLLLSYLPIPSSSSRSLATSVRCNPQDYAAMMKIKAAFGNASAMDSWVPNTDCCNWRVVECDPNTNRVTQILLSGHIYGQIPPEIGDLTYIQEIIFILMHLTGTIPSTITKLKYLTVLRLSYNSLSGPVPSFLSQLPLVNQLELSHNKFSGTIPPSLSNLPSVTYLYLDYNNLTGEIPESFGKFKQPGVSLYLSHNQLSGELPKSFGNLDFDTIQVSSNKLHGDASLLFKANGSARILYLSRNKFEFDLSKMKLANTLQYFDISHNKIYGSIPKAITKLNLKELNVSYNSLCGKIPQGGDVQNYDSYSFFHNKCLCGSPLAACK